MATAYVPQLEKVAGMGIVERELQDDDNAIRRGEKHSASTGRYESEFNMKAPNDAESANPTQKRGVARAETLTVVWTKKWLVAAYFSIVLISFVLSLQQQAHSTVLPFATSAFQKHALTALTGIVANVVGGVSKLPLAKFIDVVGRPQGFLICLVFVVGALVLMSVCQTVGTYCAAQVLYWLGMNGIDYVFNVFIADTSLLQNRLLWIALTGAPYICNSFAGPKLGQAFLDHSTWRWSYGSFAIITPFVSMSFWLVFLLMGRKAKQSGIVGDKKKSGRTLVQSIRYWCVEFDLIGLLLICAGFSILLLPFTLAAAWEYQFTSPRFLCMVIFGILLLVIFVVWERFFAPKTFFPFHLTIDRSVIAACLMGANSWIAFYAYKMYYSSYLQVVFNLSAARAGYISNIFNVVSCTWAVAISFAFKYTDTYKWGAVVAVPLQILMTGLLIKFREPGTHLALLVMVEVFGAMAGAMLVQIEQVAIMAAVPHEDVAVGLALLSLITSIGGSIGQSISGAIWTQMLPAKLDKYLPEEFKSQTRAIVNDLVLQVALPWGSPEREALIQSYADVMRTLLIMGTVALVPCILWTAMLKNYRMSEHTPRKGLQA